MYFLMNMYYFRNSQIEQSRFQDLRARLWQGGLKLLAQRAKFQSLTRIKVYKQMSCLPPSLSTVAWRVLRV
jgi:hypothetical protein